ncbi:MAG: nicotinate-nicotinamide nucleotide adenylyltransferase [bacterium]|nr:nicotinate-nicotinamide nucleotide adenylyltransferase [bacterium]
MNEFLKSWLDKRNRIVIFAGVFDPVHRGHLSAAKTALKHGKKVIFFPERKPQHKHGMTPYEHRLQMLRLACETEPKFEVVDYPEDQQFIEPFYKWLGKKYPQEKFVWLVGSDVVSKISTWPGADKLKKLGVESVIYLNRSGHELNDVIQVSEGLSGVLIRRTRRWNIVKTHAEMNSGNIRRDFKKYRNSLMSEVANYAEKNKLY